MCSITAMVPLSDVATSVLRAPFFGRSELSRPHKCTTIGPPNPQSLKQAAFNLKRLESAQRRYLNSMKMLTTVRASMPAGLAPYDPDNVRDKSCWKRA
jgi:hypothetical protein